MQLYVLLIIIIFFTPIFIACAVAADISLTASSKLKLYKYQKAGNVNADTVLKLQENIGSVSASIHLFETTIHTLSTTFTTAIIAHMLPEYGSHIHAMIVTFILTFTVVTYGEITPVIYVYSKPETISLFCAPYLWKWYRFTYFITYTIEKIAVLSLRLFNININKSNKIVDSDELKVAIDLHGGDKQSYEKTILKSILDIKNIDVSDIMIHRNKIISVDITDDILNIIDIITKSNHTRIPIWEDNTDNIIGVIHTKDLIRTITASNNLTNQEIRKIMNKPCFIPETTTLFAQMQRFREEHSHIAFVVDEYGSLEGMVTLEDILEEIVGEILDEHDEELSQIVITKKGEYIIPGDTTIRDINKTYHLSLPEMHHISTIAGLIFEVSKKIPLAGEEFNINDKFTIKVLKMNKNKILLAQLTPNNRV